MEASYWNPSRVDNRDTDANDWDSPDNASNCDAQRDPTLEEKVGTLNSASAFLTRNGYIFSPH
jgi:hypothetical protein